MQAQSNLFSAFRGAHTNEELLQAALAAGEVVSSGTAGARVFDTPEGVIPALLLTVVVESEDPAGDITFRLVPSKRFEKGFAIVSMHRGDSAVPYPLPSDLWGELKGRIVKAWNTYVATGGATAGGVTETAVPNLLPPVSRYGKSLEAAAAVLKVVRGGKMPVQGMTLDDAYDLAITTLQIQARSLTLGEIMLEPEVEQTLRTIVGAAGLNVSEVLHKAKLTDLLKTAADLGSGAVLTPADVQALVKVQEQHAKLVLAALKSKT